MVQRRRGVVPGLAMIASMLLVSGAAVAATRARHPAPRAARARGGDAAGARPAAPRRPPEAARPGSPAVPGSPARPGPDAPLPPGTEALIDVAVATLWVEPGLARPVDRPSLTNPVDVPRWLSAMTVAERRWLVGRLATQALYGDRVTVLEGRGDWARVIVTGQPSSLDPRGYPGWLPAVQLNGRPAAPDPGRSATVTTPVSTLREVGAPNRPTLELSYDTRLPVLGVEGPWATVATPGNGRGLLARSDVDISDSRPSPPAGADLVRSARLFSGVPYLWAGASALGFDCSGFTWAVYRAHGIVIPRDAADQAAAGVPVDRSHLEPGDLLFYASGPGPETVHHVAMYVGNATMIQSPATGRAVETVAVDTPEFAREFRVARRYVSS